MIETKIFQNQNGVDFEVVEIHNENGSYTSMLKSAYDTLASESNPTGGNN